ncbi:uncharacterized protein [Diabrotica undecimpunctata]|uniref:uncharacterized protein n=1 Tax=Diabrotica undecimpunctata TaxID=50387 RepID=UPI003B63DEC0
MSRYRGVRTQKAYLCLFLCCATNTLHLELANDLAAEAFLAALQRFIARKGRVSQVFCDNGTNFHSVYRQLSSFMESALNKENIKFSFASPAAPHIGGIYERGIRSVKEHIVRIVGAQILTYEEFYTVLTLIESVLNSRPLIPLTNDIEDLNALTPGHFLTLEPLSSLSVLDFSEVSFNRLSRWQLLQRIHRDFGARWRKEYLHTLQQKSKWLDSVFVPKIGALVVLKEDNLAACKWSLTRLVELHEGRAGVARVATMRTITGTLKRPLVRICQLPIDEDWMVKFFY